MGDLLVGLVAGVVCAAGAVAMPHVVARLPEPAPAPEPAEGVDPTAAQQTLLDEGPKEPYVDMARSTGFVRAVVLTAGVSGALLGGALGAQWTLLLVLPLAPLGAALALIDLRSRLLPSRLVLPATAACLVFGLVAWPLTGSSGDLVRGVVGMVLARSVFWVLWFIRSAGMGFGDVRLSALLGFVLAYLGWAQFAVGLYAPFLIFAIPGLVLAIVRRDRSLLKQAFPFGPSMLCGAVVGVAVGEQLLGGLVLG